MRVISDVYIIRIPGNEMCRARDLRRAVIVTEKKNSLAAFVKVIAECYKPRRNI